MVLLLWLTGAGLVFALLTSTSHIALRSLPEVQGLNIRSQLDASYSPWEDLAFQPVDPAIIEEIQVERDLPKQLIVDGPEWATPTASSPSSLSHTPAVGVIATETTPEPPGIHPTETQPPIVWTPVPTDANLNPISTATPPVSQPRPTKTRKPHKTPKPPRPGKSR